MAVHHHIQVQLAVKGHAEGLAHVEVVKGWARGIEDDIPGTQANSRDQLIMQRLGGISEPLDRVHTGDIHIPRFIQPLWIAGVEGFHHIGDGRRSKVKILVALIDYALARAPLHQLVRPGAVRMAVPVAPRFDVGFVHHKSGGIGELQDEVGLGRVDRDLQSMGVQRLQPADVLRLPGGHLLHPHDIAEIDEGRIRSQRRAGRALPRIHHILRGHGTPVVEGGVRPQVEDIDHPVRADAPALGQVGRQVEARVEGHQPAEDALVARAPRRGRIVIARVVGFAALQHERLVQRHIDLQR